MFEDYYMTADDVAKALKISKSFAYIWLFGHIFLTTAAVQNSGMKIYSLKESRMSQDGMPSIGEIGGCSARRTMW